MNCIDDHTKTLDRPSKEPDLGDDDAKRRALPLYG
jgi:hypothetical protein